MIARPTRDQESVYNGKDKVHCLKWQGFTLPDGIIANFYGPTEGRLHDASLLRESHILDHVSRWRMSDGRPLVIYGDKAYPLSEHLITPYYGVERDRAAALFNLYQNAGRITVEWAFGDIAKQFAFTDFPKNQKLLLQPVGLYYRVAALLCNIRTCLYGSQTSKYFGVAPLTLDEYLQ